jgi:Fe-S cluster biogenesis protein NfuA
MNDTLSRVKAFTEANIAPMLAQHNGAVEIVSYDPVDRVVSIRYVGMCSHCPSSYLSTYQAILSLLQAEFTDEVADIERV